MTAQNQPPEDKDMHENGGLVVGRDVQTDGGDFVGRDHIVFSGNVIVLNSPSEAVLQELAKMVSLQTEVSLGSPLGIQGLLPVEDRAGLQRSIDQILHLFDTAAQEGVKAQGLAAGKVEISRVELLLKKAILQRAEADEMLLDHIQQQRSGLGTGAEDDFDMSASIADFDETPKQSKLEGAFALLQEANEIDPTNTEVLLQMAELLVELTPDDPRDEERILQRIHKLLRDPKDDREKFRLAQASFLLATTRDQIDRVLLEQARKIFETLGRAEWLRQCDALFAGIPGETNLGAEQRLSDSSGRPPASGFNPAGRWQIQVMDAVGSIMYIEFYPNGTFESVQQVASMGLNVQAAGQWAFNPINNAFEIQGLINGLQPFMLGIFIQGEQENGYYGLGTDGYGYLLTHA
jgi:hypothetical protein